MNREKKIILSAQNLQKDYELAHKEKKLSALAGISFDIYENECFAIVGESGCGKSTLAKTVVGLVQADEGELIYKGQSILKLKNKEKKEIKKDIQIIFQDPYASVNPRMKIKDIVAEPLRTYKMYENKFDLYKRVEELLLQVGIKKEAMNRYPHQFSGGQRQRICIARALAPSPELIICDEPVSALDVSIQAQVLNLLKDIKKDRKLTYIFISHDLSVVKFMADRVCVMYLGKICEIGTTKQIYENPAHPYTKLLLDCISSSYDNDERMQEFYFKESLSPINPPKICRFHTRCPYAKEICKSKEPELKAKGERIVFCHFPIADMDR